MPATGRLVPQSALVRAPDPAFRSTPAWTRLSFLELLAPASDRRPPPWKLEPAYDEEGTTLVAVWPADEDYEKVRVATWAPDSVTLVRLAELQDLWPPALADVLVQLAEGGQVRIRPCEISLARKAALSETALAERVRHALEMGARRLGRSVTRAA
jgi:hypothetical protein